MLDLSRKMWELPRRPGARGHSSHDLGIDRLRRSHTISSCLNLIYAIVDEFEYRPTAAEVERVGTELFRTKSMLDKILQ